MSTNTDLHVIFGTGPAGTSLAEELVRRGKRVRLVNRSGKGEVPAGAELVMGDASRLERVQELCAGAAVVYNCTHAPYENWPEILPRLQENLIEGAASAGARLVVIDTLYLYGDTHGQPMNDNSPHNATSRKGRLRAELAWGYLQANRVGKVPVAIGRAADFYGPHVLNSVLGQYVFPAALTGQPALTFGNIDLLHSYSYMPDIARGLATLGEREEALGHDWLLPVAPEMTTRAICELIGKEIGQPVQIFNAASLAQAQQAGIFDQTLAYEYKELFYQYMEPQIVDSSAFEKSFGVRATAMDEAIRATVEWYRGRARA